MKLDFNDFDLPSLSFVWHRAAVLRISSKQSDKHTHTYTEKQSFLFPFNKFSQSFKN